MKVKSELKYNAKHILKPNKTFEEIQAEVDAFNKAQRELIENEE